MPAQKQDTESKQDIENKFGRFFYTQSYIRLKNNLFNYRFRKSMIKKFFFGYFGREIDEKFVIADIGSGISAVTPIKKKTIFIELEKEAVEFLKNTGLNAIQGDITNLPLRKEAVDIALCSEVLEHVKDYEKALKEISRVLKKGGGAIITVPIHMKYWKDDDEFVGHYRRFNPNELRHYIKKAGFKIVKVEPIGSKAERFLTWLTVKIARKTDEKNFNISKLRLIAFNIVNTILLQIVKMAYIFTSEETASILLVVAVKQI